MFKLLKTSKRKAAEGGQALIEFALVAPILTLLLLGLIDFGAILFSYAQASGSLRDALRYAEILGYADDASAIPYLDCVAMEDAAENNFYTSTHYVTITYVSASGSTTAPFNASGEYVCPPDVGMSAGQQTALNAQLVNGDMLQIEIEAHVDPFFLPTGPLNFTFTGQRSIVKALPIVLAGTGDDFGEYIPPGSGGGGDSDGDGIPDSEDLCPELNDTNNNDTDGDGFGDPCDYCPDLPTETNIDSDGDGVGDACEGGSGDSDGDGIPDSTDLCPELNDPDNGDDDGDGFGNPCDYCPDLPTTTNIDSDGDGIGDACEVEAPNQPTLSASVDCSITSGNNVSFNWSLVTPPDPTNLEVYRVAGDVGDPSDDPWVRSESSASGTCTNCTQINTKNGEACYYMAAIVDSPPDYFRVDSDWTASGMMGCVSCLQTPNPMASFNATCVGNSAVNPVNFSWTWGSNNPYPTSLEIRRKDDDYLIYSTTVTAGGLPTSCPSCTSLSAGDSKEYYIVAIHGTGISGATPLVSTKVYDTATCDPATTGTLKVCLKEYPDTNCGSTATGFYGGESIILYDNPPTSSEDGNTSFEDGCYIYPTVDLGDYFIHVNTKNHSGYKIAAYNVDGTCIPSTSQDSPIITIAGSGHTIDVLFVK